jgi:hypothetical protein
MAPMVRAEQWYNSIPTVGMSSFISDDSSILVGFPTIRQLRIKNSKFGYFLFTFFF